MGNPMCPEEGCKRVMQIKECDIFLGKDERGKKRFGRSKFYICPIHKHQTFKVGAEVILRKPIPIEEPKLETASEKETKPKRKGRQMQFIIPRRIRRKIQRDQQKK